MQISPEIFREYDIRGIVGRDLTPELARAVGRAYGTHMRRALTVPTRADLPELQVVVGMDNRPTSPDLTEALVQGLLESGISVLELGVVPTPVVWWAEHMLDGVHGALQVTGSHNPADWNGIKMTRETRSLHGAEVQAIRRTIESGAFEAGEGSRTPKPVLDRYVRDMTARLGPVDPVKVVVDCGNGTGSVVAPQLLEALGVQVVPLYCESDGTFPNHHPDPTVDENLVDLMARVREEGAAFGVSFDGDADRIGVVDDRGRVVRADLLLLLLGLDLLERNGPDQLLIFDVKCSQVLPDVYEAAGGRTLMWKTGHSLMKEKMRETGAPLAGELSGHICFGGDEYLGMDDALFCAGWLARMQAAAEEPLSAQVDRFPSTMSTPEIRLDVTETLKREVVELALDRFSGEYEVNTVDGARIQFEDGWALIRASNTQPVLVLRFEAGTEAALREIRDLVEGWLAEQGVHV